jgi:hypothetical protein
LTPNLIRSHRICPEFCGACYQAENLTNQAYIRAAFRWSGSRCSSIDQVKRRLGAVAEIEIGRWGHAVYSAPTQCQAVQVSGRASRRPDLSTVGEIGDKTSWLPYEYFQQGFQMTIGPLFRPSTRTRTSLNDVPRSSSMGQKQRWSKWIMSGMFAVLLVLLGFSVAAGMGGILKENRRTSQLADSGQATARSATGR